MKTKSHDLKELMSLWLDLKPNRDLTLLSKLSGVPYNTLRRLYACQNEPECYTVVAILEQVASKEDSYVYLNKHFPLVAKFMKPELEEKIKFTRFSDKTKILLEDFISFLVSNLAYARLATKETISSIFGQIGLNIANNLVEQQILIWSENQLLPFDGCDVFKYDRKNEVIQACEHILTLAKTFGHPVALVGSVTQEEFEKVQMITREYCSSIKEIIFNSKNGDKFVATSVIFATLNGGESLT